MQGSSFYHSELEVVDEQRHQEKYLGCMTTGKGITFFPPADNTRPIESKKGALPVHIRSDNGPEFIARILRKWLEELGVKTLFIEPGSPWENGYVESFNGKMQDELRNREIFYTLKEAQILIERWRKEDNTIRHNSSLGYQPPLLCS